MNIRKASIILLMMLFSVNIGFAQKPIDKMTKEDVMTMSYDQLADLPLDELMRLADIVGVSIDDLFNMVLNKDVSIASKSSESFFDTPLSTSVLSAEDIARSGVLSIPEAMRLIPGVIVREKTNGNYDIHIRGNDNVPYGQRAIFSENTLTLVMIDGRVVYNYGTGGTFWESIPIGLNDVDRIEVVRGPASALYGPNAVSGVINIITKKVASKKPSVDASIISGNRFGSLPSSMAVSGNQNLGISFGANDKLKFRISGNYNYRDRSQEDVYMWKQATNTVPENGYYPVDSVTLLGLNPEEAYEDHYLSLDALGANGYIFYTPTQDIDLTISAGTQRSTAISSNVDAGDLAHTTRKVETGYVDVKATIYGFHLQANYMGGTEDFSLGSPGTKFDVASTYVNLDYNWQLFDSRLSIRPGVSFANISISDKPYLEAGKRAFLSDKKTVTNYAPNIRVDYAPFEKLRLIGAFRYEKNSIPDKAYPTWQLIANYKIQETSSVRAVYSRANRSPFLLDVATNMSVTIPLNRMAILQSQAPGIPFDSRLPNDITYQYAGNENIKLATMDMVELGFRQKLGQRILLNFELFYSRLKDLDYLAPDMIKVAVPGQENTSFGIYNRHFTYNNIKEVSHQYGATVEAGVVVNRKVNFRLFGTLQQTNLKNHDEMTNEEKADGMYVEASKNWPAGGAANWVAFPTPADNAYSLSQESYHEFIPENLINTTNKMTPAFYGGFEINYLPIDKISITSTGYGFTKQTYIHQFGAYDISSKMLVNMRVAYRFLQNSSVFMTVNNIFNSKSTEFGFMDKTGAMWFWGVNMKF